jgi:hypothetical protein
MSSSVSRITAKGLNSVLILGAWTLWQHRNACLFDGALPSLSAALVMASFGSGGWPTQVSCPCSPVLIRGPLVGLFGRVAIALGSVLVILSSAVSGMLPGCVLAFRVICLCLLCVWCFLFCVSVVVCFVMFPLLLMK